MKKRTYAREITKDYLKSLGITDVTTDGLHVYKDGKEVKQCKTRSGKKHYYSVTLYDPKIRQSIPTEERTSGSGQFTLGVHVINYVWNKSDKPKGIVIDHLDNDPFNNDINNLDPKTPKANLHKEHKDWCKGQLKCSLSKPLSFYEDKLTHYLELHDEAQKQGDKDACHKLRCNISQTRKRINYWKAHQEEAEKLQASKEAAQAKKDAYHEKAARLRELEEITIAARMAYLQAQWDYGKDSFMTQCAKQEWREAVRNRNEFLGIKGKNDGF